MGGRGGPQSVSLKWLVIRLAPLNPDVRRLELHGPYTV